MAIRATLDDDGNVNELVEMIDRLIDGGDGHLTVNVDENAEGMKVTTYRTTDCGKDGKKGACCQPNEKSEDDD